MAKSAIASSGAKAVVIELDDRRDGSQIQSYLGRKTGRRTVPNVFIGGKSVGGGQETDKLRRSGKLNDLLRAAGAI